MQLKELKKYYNQQAKEDCIQLIEAININQIVLIRHARPITKKRRFVNFEEAEESLQDYRNSSVDLNFITPVCISNIGNKKIYHSDLPRSRETAYKIFPPEDFQHIENRVFRELDRENLKLPFRVPYKFHTTLSRIMWLTGRMKNIETPATAFKRLKENAMYLNKVAVDEHLVILVAHGFHNFFVGRFLKDLGYKALRTGGNKHLALNIWGKEVPETS